MPCYHPLEGYKNSVTGGWQYQKGNAAQKLTVACGSCLGCRCDYRLMWSIRIMHEAAMHIDTHGNSWATLTYRSPSTCTRQQLKDGHYVPSDYSLRPSHVSDFIRSLRKANAHKKIRYYYSAEYGELGRPHYHICLFNHAFHDQYLWEDDQGKYTYTSLELDSHWAYGFSTVSELNLRTAAYTAGYCLAKITGKKSEDHYLRCDEHGEAYWLMPEYCRMSTGRGKPSGIGASFYEKFKSDIFPSDTSPVPGYGEHQLVPRYYQKILEKTDPSMLAQIKATRQEFISAHAEDFTPQALKDKYICARAKQKMKQRILL